VLVSTGGFGVAVRPTEGVPVQALLVAEVEKAESVGTVLRSNNFQTRVLTAFGKRARTIVAAQSEIGGATG
jgi:hypothetical protein